jgi:hypothetical protein
MTIRAYPRFGRFVSYGDVDDGFGALTDVFEDNFAPGGDLGIAGTVRGPGRR